MAIYHFSAKVVSRSKGQSSVASAAYRAGENLHDERIGKDFDYTRKQNILHTEIVTPENAPDFTKDREQLWNAVEKAEKRKDAQIAREVEVALPRELTLEDNIKLTKKYVEENFTDKGMIADIAIHESINPEGEKNPHAHIMLTTRAIGEEGFSKKERDWNNKELLKEWREKWADSTNDFLHLAGSVQRIDHRTLDEQGVDREPTIHLGQEATAMERKGIESERGTINREIEHQNRVMAAIKSATQWMIEKPIEIYHRVKDRLEERTKELELTPERQT